MSKARPKSQESKAQAKCRRCSCSLRGASTVLQALQQRAMNRRWAQRIDPEKFQLQYQDNSKMAKIEENIIIQASVGTFQHSLLPIHSIPFLNQALLVLSKWQMEQPIPKMRHSWPSATPEEASKTAVQLVIELAQDIKTISLRLQPYHQPLGCSISTKETSMPTFSITNR